MKQFQPCDMGRHFNHELWSHKTQTGQHSFLVLTSAGSHVPMEFESTLFRAVAVCTLLGTQNGNAIWAILNFKFKLNILFGLQLGEELN